MGLLMITLSLAILRIFSHVFLLDFLRVSCLKTEFGLVNKFGNLRMNTEDKE